jgi:hypothetical protein
MKLPLQKKKSTSSETELVNQRQSFLFSSEVGVAQETKLSDSARNSNLSAVSIILA